MPSLEKPDSREAKVWQPCPRDVITAAVHSKEPWKRAGLVCPAGFGKTTNMEWLGAILAGEESAFSTEQYAAFRKAQNPHDALLLRLDDATVLELLECVFKNGQDVLIDYYIAKHPELVRNSDDDKQLRTRLLSMRTNGKLTLLLDGLDHALAQPHLASWLNYLCNTSLWKDCPIWVAGRPYAFEQIWSVFGDGEWAFLKVEPLAVPEIWDFLHYYTERDCYHLIPQIGRELCTNPRLLRLIAGILKVDRALATQLNTAADVYHLAYFTPGDFIDTSTAITDVCDEMRNARGLIAQGLL